MHLSASFVSQPPPLCNHVPKPPYDLNKRNGISQKKRTAHFFVQVILGRNVVKSILCVVYILIVTVVI